MSDNPSRRAVPDMPPLPPAVRRSRRGAAARESFSLELETVTPILGGAPVLRTVDEIDVIRAPTIRGHLRFWWRALYGGNYTTKKDLFEAEAALWGKAADDKGGRSEVEITVEVRRPVPAADDSDVDYRTGAYALWPAMAIREQGKEQPPAPRYPARLRFCVAFSAPDKDQNELRNSVRAWLLFGGYGSRTRRGLGALRLVDSHAQTQWLPSIEDPDDIGPEDLRSEFKEALAKLFGKDIFGGQAPAKQMPTLSGATLVLGGLHRRDGAQCAWLKALHWIRDFRQQPGVAREPGHPPGRSRWPEADKLRHLSGRYGHPARYSDRTAAWPRAEFGLPIVGRFIGQGEPGPFVLSWEINEASAKPGENRAKDRLASPLIVKPIQTVQGFYPCALWLRSAPPPGKIVAAVDGRKSNAPFGFIGTSEDLRIAERLRAPFARKPDIKTAFIDWLRSKDGVVQVAP
jgi:CRISPR-associated protein Cmr1